MVAALLAPLVLAAVPAKALPTVGQFVSDMLGDSPIAMANACAARNPAMKAEYDLALVKWRTRVKAIVARLLTNREFETLNREPVPQELIDQQQARAERLRNADAPKDCQVFLAGIRDPDDAKLEPDISAILASIKGVIESMKVVPK